MLNRREFRNFFFKLFPEWFSSDPQKITLCSLENFESWENKENEIKVFGVPITSQNNAVQYDGIKYDNIDHVQNKMTVIANKLDTCFWDFKLALNLVTEDELKGNYDNCILDRIEEIIVKDATNEGAVLIYNNKNFILIDTFVAVIKELWDYILRLVISFNPKICTEEILFWIIFLGVKPETGQTKKEALDLFINGLGTKKGTLTAVYQVLDNFFNPGVHQENYILKEAAKDSFSWNANRKYCVLNLYTYELSSSKLKELNILLKNVIPVGIYVHHFMFMEDCGYGSSYALINGIP